MNIVLYSTNTNTFDSETFKIQYFPSCHSSLEKLAKKYPQHNFFIVTQKPGMFLLDQEHPTTTAKEKRIEYFISRSTEPEKIADEIQHLNPDAAFPLSFWVTPYDWLSLGDSLIATILQEKGITTNTHPLETNLICFDKIKTQDFLQKNNFLTPKGMHIDQELFWADRAKKEITYNNYKNCIFYQLTQFKYPLVIKNIHGVSSYGIDIAHTYNEAKSFLLSKRNNCHKIVQEYIDGLQFGTEIYGKPGNYSIQRPFLFSVNKYGITSPKQSIKLGPIQPQQFHFEKLEKQLTDLAEKLQFKGIAQVDLVYKNEQWYIIEINPRISGMTQCYAALFDASVPEIAFEATNWCQQTPENFTLNYKLPLLTQEQFSVITKLPSIFAVTQFHNTIARQEREKGYCEIIFKKTTSLEKLQENLKSFIQEFPDFIEENFEKNANLLFSILKE